MPWQWQRNEVRSRTMRLRKTDISKPMNFVHNIHADYDPLTGEIRGLPSQWKALLGSDFLARQRKTFVKYQHLVASKSPSIMGTKLDKLVECSTKCEKKWLAGDDQFMKTLLSMVNNFKFRDPRKEFTDFIEVGVGSTGVVFKAKITQTGRTVALKCMDIRAQERRYLLLNEVLIPRELVHPNLVRMFDSFLVAHQLWLVSEFAEHGPLTRIVTQRRLPEPLIATVCQQVLHALAYIHQRGIVHRDVKSDSVLIAAGGVVKLSDFGFCARLTDAMPKRRSLLGTPYWFSAQVALKEEYGTETDIWSLGITIFEMIFGEPPYFDEEPEIAVDRIIRNPAPRLPPSANASLELDSFCTLMLQKEPYLRASAPQLLRHPFLRISLPDPSTILPMFDGLQD